MRISSARNTIYSQDLNGPKIALVKDSTTSEQNQWFLDGATPGQSGGSIGVDINGDNQEWHLSIASVNVYNDSGKSLVVESTAQYNNIFTSDLQAGFTNNSVPNWLHTSDFYPYAAGAARWLRHLHAGCARRHGRNSKKL